MTTQSPLKERAILIDFDGGFYEWHRRDKKVERDVAKQAGVRSDVGHYIKNIFYGTDQLLVSIRRCVQDARAASDRMTLPWHPSRRLLLNVNFLDHKRLIVEANNDLDNYSAQLRDQWDDMIADAKGHLGPLWRSDSYPTLETVLARTYVRATPYPLADENDVRLEADDEYVEEIRKEVAANEARLFNDAIYAAWERLFSVVENAHWNTQKLAKYNRTGRFRTEWVDHIADLAPILKGLNISGDPRLDAMADRLSDINDALTTSTLKPHHDATRKRVADLYNDLAAIYKPMQADKEAASGQ